jgi:hypothetical protein
MGNTSKKVLSYQMLNEQANNTQRNKYFKSCSKSKQVFSQSNTSMLKLPQIISNKLSKN